MMNVFNKTLLATTIATTMVASVQADNHEVDPLTVYGRVNVSLQSDEVYTGMYTKEDKTKVQSNASRVGVKGGLMLSEGLEAFYTIEYQVDTGLNSEDNFKARNQFVGLKGKIGAVAAGRNDTVLKKSEGKVDQFNNLSGDIKHLFAGQKRQAQTVTYMTPGMGNFKAGVTYVAEASEWQSGQDGYSLAAMYGDKHLMKTPVFASVAYDSDVGGYEITRVTAQAKLGSFKLGAMYQQQEVTYLAGKSVSWDSQSGYVVSASYQMNSIVLKGQYQDMGEMNSALNNGRDSWSLGADYMLGKPTKLFVAYTDRSRDDWSKSDTFMGLGLEHKF